jgi:hypothetical protein
MDAPELVQVGEKTRDMPKSTLAERKHVIMELFEISQVLLLAFPDPERLLRQRPEMLMTEARAESDFNVVAGICFYGIVMIRMVICGRFIGSKVFVPRREE